MLPCREIVREAGQKLFYALRMPSFARERVKVLAKFTGIPEALAAAFDADPKRSKQSFIASSITMRPSREQLFRFSL